MPGVLIAGIGNIFLGDDAFGVEVAQRLLRRELPAEVKVIDYGIRGFDLAFALMDDYDAVILVDATARGGEPGTLYTIEPDLASLNDLGPAEFDAHGLTPTNVLAMVKGLGGEPRRVLIVGCEPSPCGETEERMGLSAPVEAAVEEALPMIQSLAVRLLVKQTIAAT